MDVSAQPRIYFSRIDSTIFRFQEETFSRRELTFIGGQAIFSCSSGDEFREDVVFEEDVSNSTKSPPKKQRTDDIGEFEGLIQSYSERNLTYDFDVYNAFAGVARYMTLKLKTSLCHGIPKAYFDWFLLWTTLKPLQRRENAPSWSWSGWIGGSWSHIWDWYTRSIQRIRRAQRKRTWIIWYERMAHDSIECSVICGDKKSSKRGFSLDSSQTVPTSRKLANAPVYYKPYHADGPAPGSGFLQFWTISLTFFLDSPTSVAKNDGPLNTCSRVGMFGKGHCEIGIVLVSESWRSSHVPGKHEFILLCEGRDERAELGKEDKEEGWKYMAMLIESHDEWVERVSVGSIEKCDVHEALDQGPVWKEYILG